MLFQGLIQWLYNLGLEIVEYMANSMLGVFNMDLGYFKSVAPVSGEILNILMAVGWALLLGNLVFQATRSMVSGIGVEGEDPTLLFLRTFVFSFLLLASRQICDMGLGLTSTVIALLQVPEAVTFHLPEETAFPINGSWLLVVIVGVVIMWQVLKLFLEIGERYVVMAVLTLSAPLAFATGGSKSTTDIFKGWVRMFGSMCVIMVFNVIFLKLLLSAMSYLPIGLDVFLWMLVIIGIARVARKIDGIITRIGLNPAITGDGLGHGLPGMFSYAVLKSVGSTVGKTIGAQGGRPAAPAGTGSKSGGFKGGFGGRRGAGSGGASTANHFAGSGAQAAGPAQTSSAASALRAGAAAAASRAGAAGTAGAAGMAGAAGTAGMAGGVHAASAHQEHQDVSFTGTAGTGQAGTAKPPARPQSGGTRRTFVAGTAGMAGAAFRAASSGVGKASGTAGTGTSPAGAAGKPGTSGMAGIVPEGAQSPGAIHPGKAAQQPRGSKQPDKPGQAAGSTGAVSTRFTAVPPPAKPAASDTVKTQTRATERTHSSVTQTAATGGDRPAGAQGAVSPARQERTHPSGTPAGQRQSRPARQETHASPATQGGQPEKRPLSGRAGTASGQRAAQSRIETPHSPVKPGGAAIPGKRAVPGGKPSAGPKAQTPRPTKGGKRDGR